MRSVLFVVLRGVAVLATLSAALLSSTYSGAARAQDYEEALPAIDVISTRIGTRTNSGSSGRASRPASPPSAAPAATATTSSGFTGGGIVGASTTIITSADIERSPSATLHDILSREPGVQVTNLFGGVNGARSTVDMRGFGAAASSNTLILINGRRINDLDIAGVDLASIPRESIDRIEITRGNSGAVLYGDGAMGGVINIVTKSGVGSKPTARFEGAFGSFNYKEGIASFSGSHGPWSASVYSNAVNSDGYRDNNFYRQLNGVGDFRYTYGEGSAYLNLSGDNSHIGLPGARRVEPSKGLDQLATDRRGATTPFDYADKNGRNATLGVTRMLAPGAEVIVDGGVRNKTEKAEFHGTFANPASSTPLRAVDTELTTASFTPRLRLDSMIGETRWQSTGGFDYYRAHYDSDRPQFLGAAPIHRYDLTQITMAGYWQQTVTIIANTDVAAGVRVQRTSIKAADTFDPNAPGANPLACFPPFGCFGDQAGTPLNKSEVDHAWHLGAEHRFNPYFAVFGRMAQSFRVPNVDERVGMVTAENGVPTTFDLKTQKSHDLEGGVRVNLGPLSVQSSIYDMRLRDEIHFRFGPNFESNNINLDPTRRYGTETIATYRLSDQVRFKGGFAYTRSVFREGLFAGRDVPLVSRWTGNVGVSWDVWDKYLTFDGVVRYVGARRMDNDQLNIQPMIPAHTVVDIRFGGEYDRYFWSFAVQNLFDADYFDYAIASPFPFGFQSQLNTYNAYPQPGRTFLLKAGLKVQ